MSNPILFVCRSCRLSDHDADHDDEANPSDGTLLFNRLLALHQQRSQLSELKIQPVDCLWTCNQPCAVALQSENKCTYLFTHLPPLEGAQALIQLSELYLSTKYGNVPWKKIPDMLKTELIARIPLVEQAMEDEN